MDSQKIYRLRPNWKYNLLPYIISLILLPVFGIGIIVFLIFWWRLSKKEYEILNEAIITIDHGDEKRLSINEIESISITHTWSEKKSNLGTLHISGTSGNLTLIGIEDAEDIKEALEIAIANERQHQKLDLKAEGDFPGIKVGGLDPMNQLVGLWQQGLISNEDFEREKDKFS